MFMVTLHSLKGCLLPVRPLPSVVLAWQRDDDSKTESKTLAKALLCGNLKLKFPESSLPRNFCCSDFEKFCQERPWAISKNLSGIFPDFAVILRNLVLWTPISIQWAECKRIQTNFNMLKMYHKRQTNLFYTLAIIVNPIYVNLWKLWSLAIIKLQHFSAGVFLERTIPLIWIFGTKFSHVRLSARGL